MYILCYYKCVLFRRELGFVVKYRVKMLIKWTKWNAMSYTDTVSCVVTADAGDHKCIRESAIEHARKIHQIPSGKEIVVLSYEATPVNAS